MKTYATKPGPLMQCIIEHDKSGNADKTMSQLGRRHPESLGVIEQTVKVDGNTLDFYLRYIEANEDNKEEVRLIAYQTIRDELFEVQERIIKEKGGYRRTSDVYLMRQIPESVLQAYRGESFSLITGDGFLHLYRDLKIINTFSRFMPGVGHQTRFTLEEQTP